MIKGKKERKNNYVVYLMIFASLGCFFAILFFSKRARSSLITSGASDAASATSSSASISVPSTQSSSNNKSQPKDGDQCIEFSPKLRPLQLGKHRIWTSISNEKLLAAATATPTVALLFHGCSHSGEVWATGAEEQILVNSLLDRSIYIIAPSSESGRLRFQANDDSLEHTVEHTGCWDVNIDSNDIIMVTEIVQTLSLLVSVPIRFIALGASSGGFFTSYLSTVLSLHAIAVYISPLHPLLSSMSLSHNGAFTNKLLQSIRYPQALPPYYRSRFFPKRVTLVSMPRDAFTESSLSRSINDLQDSLATDSITRFSLVSRPISPTTFSEMMPWLLSSAASERLFSTLPAEFLSPIAPSDVLQTLSPSDKKSDSKSVWLLEDARAIPNLASAVDKWIDKDLKFVGMNDMPHFTLKSEGKISSTASADVVPARQVPGQDLISEAAFRILRRNVLEILQERFAVHEMSSQFSKEIIDFLTRD